MATRLILGFLFAALALCACSDDEEAPLAQQPTNVRYVDAGRGGDSGDGSSSSPWATISHAVAIAGENFTIYVAPSTYDTLNGESFPIFLKPGQKLIGDVPNKGRGTIATRIQGEGDYAHGLLVGAVVVGAAGARVAGFAIVTQTAQVINYSGIVIDDSLAMEIDHNTFENNLYSGVGAVDVAAPDIHDNLFESFAYGLYLDSAGAVHVHDNVIVDTFFGIRYFGITGAIIEDNTIYATSAGVQTGVGTSTIRNNRFTFTGTYSRGAITCGGPTHVVRGNWFGGGPALWVEFSGTPDAGTQADPGQNDFSDIMGVVINHTGSALVTAVGNTWANYPPQVGVEIIITGTGSVVWE